MALTLVGQGISSVELGEVKLNLDLLLPTQKKMFVYNAKLNFRRAGI
jgi:hypothetical protein